MLTESLELTSDHTGTVIDAYGNSADGLPEWRCDDVVDPGGVALAAGRTNVYKVTVSVETDVLAAEWPGMWEDDVALSPSAVDLSANEGKPGTFWHGTVTDLSTIDLYFHPYGSTDPTSDGKEYRYAKRNGLNAWAAEDVTIRNQKGRRNYTSYGSIRGGRGALIENCEVHEGNTHNIFYRPGPSASGRTTVLRNCLARDSFRPDQGLTLYICYENTAPAGSRATLSGCRADLTYNSRLPVQAVTGATSANPCVLTIAGHGLSDDDIILAENFTAPWDVLNGQHFVVDGATTDTFQIDTMTAAGDQVFYNTSGLASYSGNGGTIRLAPVMNSNIGFYAHTSSGTIEQIDYTDCESEGLGNGFAGFNTATVNIVRPTIEQSYIAFGDLTGDVHVTDPVVTNDPPITGATAWRSGGADSSYTFEGGTWRLHATGNFRPTHTGCTLVLDGITTYGFNTLIRSNVADTTISAVNNDFIPEGRQTLPYNIGAGSTGLDFTSDYNDFNGASTGISYLGTTYPTFDGYRTASGQDANSTP